MPFPDSPASKSKKLLILTSSGGGGLIQAANAKEQEARAKDPTLVIVRRDVLKDWMGSVFGKFCSEMWNGPQRKGNIAALRFAISAQSIFDVFAWPYFFLRALLILFKEGVDQVIDTQPLGTAAILKAIRIYNRKRNKQVRLQKILVDLPTKSATHFFRSIKKLSKNDRPFLQLTTIAPLLEDGQTAEEFWQTNCRLSEKEIHYEDVYVRQSFRQFQKRPKAASDFPVFVRFKNQDELRLLKKTFGKGSLKAFVRGNEVHFKIAPTDRLITVLLGSQPASDSTFNYVKKFIQLAKESGQPKHKCHIFVFCSDHQPREESLYRKVSDYVGQVRKYPEWLTVIPFSFQNDDCVARLFYRSDLTCTRSGGQTAMELMCVSTGEILIHSETKIDPELKRDPSLEELLLGIPGWEAANALYLKKICNADIVTPDTLGSFARKFLQTEREAAISTHSLAPPLERSARQSLAL